MRPSTVTRRQTLRGTAGLGVAVAAPGLLMASGTAAGQEGTSKYGILARPAPELLVDYWIDGKGEPTSFTLAEHRGKWVFLKFFQAWCPGCHASGFPALQEVSNAFKDEPRVVAAGLQTTFEGFGTNTRERVREMQLRYELDIPMGHDEGARDGIHQPITMLNYRSGGTPWIVVVDPTGYVVYNDFHISAPRLIEHVKGALAA